jgi:hypothetical protein
MDAGGFKQVQYKEYICWMQVKIYISDQTSLRICNSVLIHTGDYFYKSFRLYSLGWQNLTIHPSRVPAKPAWSTTYLWIKLYRTRKDYIKNTGNGGRWRW